MMIPGWTTTALSTFPYKEIWPCRAATSSAIPKIVNFPENSVHYLSNGCLIHNSVVLHIIIFDVKHDVAALYGWISLYEDADDAGANHPSIIKKTETKISLCLEPRVFCPKGWLITICSLNGHLKLYKIESLDSFWVPKTVRFLPPKRWVIAKIQPKSCQILPKSLWSHGQNTLFCERLQFISAWGSKRKQRPTTTSSIFTIDFFYLWKNYSQNIRLMLEWQLYIIFLLTLENN